ncbi:hypothetical protein KY285_031360 [Solanum tuberosum]|nr:hypothetical protein KY284_031155 [Solanum tuberosum]KAH0656478.1 hypothetical protein KY285_031360 [Solanum tuberosum]
MGRNGRIWLLWKNSAQIQVEKLSEQFIHCTLSDGTSDFKSKLTLCMPRMTVLRELNFGDFNNVLSSEDRLGSSVLPGETQDFQACIDTLELTALKAIGCHYTFCNKQQGSSRVYSKIDWAFGNFPWMTAYSHVDTDYLGSGISDHSPILIQSVPPPPNSNPKPFRLFKTVLNHPDFGRLIDEDWQKQVRGTTMERLWQN